MAACYNENKSQTLYYGLWDLPQYDDCFCFRYYLLSATVTSSPASPAAVHPRFSLPACLLLFLRSFSPSLSPSFHVSLLPLLSLSSLSLDMTLLLRYNSHKIQVTYVKCAIGWFLVYSQAVQPAPRSILKSIHRSEKKLHPLAFALYVPHSPKRPLTYFLSL